MNRNRLLVGLAIAILLAFLVSSFVYKQFQRATAIIPVTTQNLVVAAVPMQVGTRLDPNNLRVISWPSNRAVSGMFTRVEDCADRALITPVAENEPILEAKLAPKTAGAGLPATIPEGMRALSVAVNDVVAVAGFVGPGTMVDVLVTGATGHGGDNITRTILENVRVLAAGQKIEQDREGKPQTVPVVTLLVSPEDAARLTMASTEGKIQLALRNTIDTKKAAPPAVLQAALFSGGPVAPAETRRAHTKPIAPPPPSLFVVEVITGAKRENKSFPNTAEQR